MAFKLLPLLAVGWAFAAWKHIPLQATSTKVQPMTGIVLWIDGGKNNEVDAIQLEFRYLRYADVVQQEGVWNWGKVDAALTEAASRSHQAILRFYDVYPNEPSGVPDYILARPDFRDTTANSEGNPTQFPDWGNAVFQDFVLEFYKRFANRYDKDPRLAFLQVGFGLWAEYHIYDGPMILGRTFPDRAYQERFLKHLDSLCENLPWGISIDAASDWGPFQNKPALLQLGFGNFDDSFLNADMGNYNRDSWIFLGSNRWKTQYAGGEFSYYNANDQENALSPNGPNGLSFAKAAADYHITFMTGADQPQYQTWATIKAASRNTGYHFRITRLLASPDSTMAWITNTGVAPLYRHAWVSANGVRSHTSLKGLLPGDTLMFAIASGGTSPQIRMECDHLVAGQQIEFDASLSLSGPSAIQVQPSKPALRQRYRQYRLNGQVNHLP